MFGTLRLALALLVALAHAGVPLLGHYHLGVPAVVVFLLLSGYVVDALCGPAGPLHGHAARFYAERAVRLLPLYLCAALLGALCVALRVPSPFLAAPEKPLLWLANATILPLNYATLWPVIDTLALVPPAWSLGLELHFYLIAPWLLAAPVRIAAAAALTFAVGAAAHLGLIPSDAWGYRLLAGNLYIFLSGAWLHRVTTQRAHPAPLLAGWLLAATVWLTAYARGCWGEPFVFEVGLGYLVGLPLVALLARLPRRRWDDLLAYLSYGVFLFHFAVQWLLSHLGWLTAARPLPLYLTATLLLAATLHLLVERPLIAWRRALRQANR